MTSKDAYELAILTRSATLITLIMPDGRKIALSENLQKMITISLEFIALDSKERGK